MEEGGVRRQGENARRGECEEGRMRGGENARETNFFSIEIFQNIHFRTARIVANWEQPSSQILHNSNPEMLGPHLFIKSSIHFDPILLPLLYRVQANPTTREPMEETGIRSIDFIDDEVVSDSERFLQTLKN
jgi:hypothetical protein